jgi:hypothetical protein
MNFGQIFVSGPYSLTLNEKGLVFNDGTNDRVISNISSSNLSKINNKTFVELSGTGTLSIKNMGPQSTTSINQDILWSSLDNSKFYKS